MDFATSALLSTAVAIGSWLMIGHSIPIQVAFAQLQPLTVFLVNSCLSQDVFGYDRATLFVPPL